jgi:3-phosphoshikimate 1-carboxyvinyltransferase
MDITIFPNKLSGSLKAIPSKSQAHRLLICAAFADAPTDLICPDTNQDIEATAACLCSLGASIHRTADGYHVVPASAIAKTAVLDCRESGSTLRFMLPVAGALGVDTHFKMSGRLPQRPLSPLWDEMERMGCRLSRPSPDTIHLEGKLLPGRYTIDGSVSSQFITGLLFAMALMDGESKLEISGKMESKPYIEMTRQALEIFGVVVNDFAVSNRLPFRSPGQLEVEGDWSNGAFFLAAKALGSEIKILGLSQYSAQGDRACEKILEQLEENIAIDAADIPDLVPILAVAAGAKKGAIFQNIARLRLKESDRVASVAAMINNLGGCAESSENELCIFPGKYHSCTIDAVGDHRIAMAAAIAATVADGPVTIQGAQCVAKSYPSFWEEYSRLGGHYEQYIR